MADVLAVAEVRAGVLQAVSREVVTVARRLADAFGGNVDAAAACGSDEGKAAAALGEQGADRVLVIDGAEQVDGRAAALSEVVRGGDYGAVVFAATGQGRDLAPRVAAKLAVPLLTDVVAAEVDGGRVVVTRPVFAGKALARVRAHGVPAVVSIRPNVFPVSHSPRAAEVVSVAPAERGAPAESGVPAESGATGGYRVVGFEASEGAALDVSEAAIIVSGGRGMKGPENWHLLADLRDALGETAALGASRAVVDAGWRPHAEQVGQTGKTVTPKLYVAVAISGAIQHLAGMRTSGVIVAVNRDADAPIFAVADYGIVGDAFEIVPELAAAIRELRGG